MNNSNDGRKMKCMHMQMQSITCYPRRGCNFNIPTPVVIYLFWQKNSISMTWHEAWGMSPRICSRASYTLGQWSFTNMKYWNVNNKYYRVLKLQFFPVTIIIYYSQNTNKNIKRFCVLSAPLFPNKRWRVVNNLIYLSLLMTRNRLRVV